MEVNDHWVFQSILGEGGFGIVELWKNRHNGEKIAIKKCKIADAQLTSKQKERWIKEINIMNKLNHPNIIATKPVPNEVKFNYTSLPVLCMEYCRKRDLRKVLVETENWCGLAEPDAIQIMKDISAAVEYLHAQNVTHRDLKPENVLLQQIPGKIVYKLIDLGYGKELGHESMYASIVGTMNYIAPELLWSEKYTCSVDYWSLGILFYEIITGCRPFLPEETNPVSWRKNIEKKSYEDISAKYVNNNVVYLQDIQDPTDLSACIRDSLVDWFRIVLQWDSKKRGKQRRDNGTDDIVVFKMLKRILTKNVVRVFSVSEYKVYSYEVGDTTSIRTIKNLIQNDNKIEPSSQELIDSLGVVLKDDSIWQASDSPLTLFKKDGTQLVNLPEPKLPVLVRKMIEMPKMEVSNYEMKRYYATAMFFMEKEKELFRYYIVALSMKIDLITAKFDSLFSKNSNTKPGIDSLRTECDSFKELLQSDMRSNHDYWQKEIQTAVMKLEELSRMVNDLKIKCDKFLIISDTLREFGNTDWMVEYSEVSDQAQSLMDSLQSVGVQNKNKPIAMTRLIVKFLNLRQSTMKSPELCKIGSQIKLMSTPQVKEELCKLENFVQSAIELIKIYRDEMSNLKKKWEIQSQPSSSCVNSENMEIEGMVNDIDQHSASSSSQSMDETVCGNSDNVIFDNLVIRYMMLDVISDTHEKFLQIINLDP